MDQARARGAAALLVVLGVSAIGWGPATAQEVDGKALSDLPSPALDAHLETLTERLERRKTHAAVWQYGWTGIFVGSIAFSSAQLATDDGDDRVTHGVSIAKSGLGLTRMLIDPHPLRKGAAPIRPKPDESREEKVARLRRGEALLAESAKRSREPYQLSQHLGILGVNLAGGAVILAFGDDDDAAFSTISGIIGGELRLWSQPLQGSSDLEAYESEYGEAASDIQWRILPTWRGAVLEVRY